METLDKYIDQVKTLPPAPKVLTELLVHLQNDDTNAEQIVELVALDPALTAKVLQRCNSADGGRRVDDLTQGISLLGFSAVYRLVAAVIGESVLSAEQRGYCMGAGELWEHSIATAVATQAIARKLNSDENIGFTAGLLHDIGKLVLSSFLTNAGPAIRSHTGKEGFTFLESEKSILGVDHAEIGGRLLERWNLPASLVSAARHHHRPDSAGEDQQLVTFVHLGDIIAHDLGYSPGLNSFAAHAWPDALQFLELTSGDVEALVIETDQALNKSNLLTRAPR